METLIHTLEIRYEAALKSSSDPTFYQNVHDYIDVVIKNPELAKIMDESENDYLIKHSNLWRPHANDEKELDRRSDETYRIERFSLYASHYCTLLVRIYWPIEYYKNPLDEFEGRLDPVAMLMIRGLERTKEMKLWSNDYLKSHYKWFDGQRKRYEDDLRQFHADFLTELYKTDSKTINKPAVVENPKPPLVMNMRTGDFSFYKTTGNFSPVGQEFKVLRTLYEDKDCQASFLSLLQSYMPNLEKENKAHKDALYQVIRNVKEKLGILPEGKASNPDIFKTVKGFGYRLILSPDETGAE